MLRNNSAARQLIHRSPARLCSAEEMGRGTRYGHKLSPYNPRYLELPVQRRISLKCYRNNSAARQLIHKSPARLWSAGEMGRGTCYGHKLFPDNLRYLQLPVQRRMSLKCHRNNSAARQLIHKSPARLWSAGEMGRGTRYGHT